MDSLSAQLYAFDHWQPNNLHDASAINLWYTMLRLANIHGLHAWFSVPMDTLKDKTGLGRSAIYEALNKLYMLKRLEVKHRKGQQSAKYRLILFCVRVVDTNPDTTADTKPDASPDTKPNAYIREIERERIDERVSTQLLQGTCVREDGLDLTWAQKDLTRKQWVYLVTLAAMEPEGRNVIAFAQGLIAGEWRDAQVSAAMSLVKSGVERGKINAPFDYLHAVLLDWAKRGIHSDAEIRQYLARDIDYGAMAE